LEISKEMGFGGNDNPDGRSRDFEEIHIKPKDFFFNHYEVRLNKIINHLCREM
jgi:hypothetical protein